MNHLRKKDWDLIDYFVRAFICRLHWIEKDSIVGLENYGLVEIYNNHILTLRQLELDAEYRYNDNRQWPEAEA